MVQNWLHIELSWACFHWKQRHYRMSSISKCRCMDGHGTYHLSVFFLFCFFIPALLYTHTSVWARMHHTSAPLWLLGHLNIAVIWSSCGFLPSGIILWSVHLHVNFRQAQIMSCGGSGTAILRCWVLQTALTVAQRMLPGFIGYTYCFDLSMWSLPYTTVSFSSNKFMSNSENSWAKKKKKGGGGIER